ncbi:hypothetical protein ACROYT_G014598 [Oculina patagonica]
MEEIISVLKRKTRGSSSSSSESALTPNEKKPCSPSETTDEINMALEMGEDLSLKIQFVVSGNINLGKHKVAGEEALEIFNTFGLSNEDKDKINVVIKKFEEYCTPKKNVAYERHVFNTRAQGATEGIDAYVTELRKLARNCEFGELHDSIIRDRIVCGIRSIEVRKRLLREKDLNLDRAVEMCKSSEITENQAKNMVVGQDDREVHYVKDDSKKLPGKSRRGNGKHNQTKKPFNCRRCGKYTSL